MPKLSLPTMLAFQDELEKLGGLNPMVGSAALLGGVSGLGTGYLGYRKAKAEGATTGQALGHGLQSGAVGAAGGAALGAGLAHVAPNVGKELSNFGQRQVHGLTGWTPAEGLHSIEHGAHDATKRFNDAHVKSILEASPENLKNLENTRKGMHAAQEAERMGITSLPGIAKSVKEHGLMNTVRAGAAEQLHGTTAATKAMMLGLPAIGIAHSALSREDSDPNAGKGERIGRAVGNVVGNLAGGPLPVIGQTVIGGAAEGAGKMVGRGIDRLRGVRPGVRPAPAVQAATGATSTDLTNGQGNVRHEVEMSPRYSGTAMEGGGTG